MHGTTIIAVRHKGRSAMAGDGQVTLPSQNIVVKRGAVKVRRIFHERVLVGFAGSVADALTLFETLESNLEETRGHLQRAVVKFARDWRSDRVLRRLEAMLLAMDKDSLYIISGNGELVEPDDGVAAIGSGGAYALAAARALIEHSALDASDIARESLLVASRICVYTNDMITVEEIA